MFQAPLYARGRQLPIYLLMKRRLASACTRASGVQLSRRYRRAKQERLLYSMSIAPAQMSEALPHSHRHRHALSASSNPNMASMLHDISKGDKPADADNNDHALDSTEQQKSDRNEAVEQASGCSTSVAFQQPGADAAPSKQVSAGSRKSVKIADEPPSAGSRPPPAKDGFGVQRTFSKAMRTLSRQPTNRIAVGDADHLYEAEQDGGTIGDAPVQGNRGRRSLFGLQSRRFGSRRQRETVEEVELLEVQVNSSTASAPQRACTQPYVSTDNKDDANCAPRSRSVPARAPRKSVLRRMSMMVGLNEGSEWSGAFDAEKLETEEDPADLMPEALMPGPASEALAGLLDMALRDTELCRRLQLSDESATAAAALAEGLALNFAFQYGTPEV